MKMAIQYIVPYGAALLSIVGIFFPYCSLGRSLSDSEIEIAVSALLSVSGEKLSSDPSCESDLSHPTSLKVSDGLAQMLTRAATATKSAAFKVDCHDRKGWPKKPGQEYCSMTVIAEDRYGLTFLLDWPSKSVVAGSVECSY